MRLFPIFCFICHIMLAAAMVLVSPLQSTAQTFSPAILEMHRVMKQHIPIDYREGVAGARLSHPVVYALSMGWVMQKQKLQAHKYSGGNSQVEALISECKKDLDQLSRDLTWESSRGNTPSYKELLEAFNNAMSGRLNQFAKEKLDYDPEKVPIPYVAGRFTTQGKVQKKKPGIVLLDEEAGGATESIPYTGGAVNTTSQNLNGLVCPMTQPGRFDYITIDNKGRPTRNRDEYIGCSYFPDGRLKAQMPKSKSGRAGVYLNFKVYNNIYFQELWAEVKGNSKFHGVYESYSLSEKGAPYLRERKMYNNGKFMGNQEEFKLLPSGKPYLYHKEMPIGSGQINEIHHYELTPNKNQAYLSYVKRYNKNTGKYELTVYNPDGSIRHTEKH